MLIAAAGNDGPRAAPAHPAALADVLAVTAIDARLRAWRRAAQGAHVDLAAPGVQIWSAASIKGRKTFTEPPLPPPSCLPRQPSSTEISGPFGDEIRQMLEARARDLGARDATASMAGD